jgi:hypothetical protein
MNLFVLDQDIQKSAQYLDDKRLNKMMLETMQLICSTLNLAGYKTPYKTTHKNHPVTIWARESRENFIYLCRYFMFLSTERKNRFGRMHKCDEVYIGLVLFDIPAYYHSCPDIPATPFKNCSLRKDIPDIVEAYRETMKIKWANDKRKPTWTNRQKPEWYNE